MSHFFLGEDVSGLAAYPFVPAFTGSVVTSARAVGLAAHEEAEVYVGPNMAGHVGSDITAGILAAGYMEEENLENRLFFDIGTNGEIVLTSKVKSYCCSTAAGPAFEGSALYQGMRAAEGAICHVHWVDGQLQTETVGGAAPKGICGSGIIDAIAVMRETGVMDHFGTIEKPFVLAYGNKTDGDDEEDVVIIQQDIREIQMAKAAIAAGSQVLMQKAGLTQEELTEVSIAGAFGSAINLESAKAIGLLPKIEQSKMRSLGNSAGIGASMMLLSKASREKAEKIARTVEHVELASLPDFQTRYIEEMNF